MMTSTAITRADWPKWAAVILAAAIAFVAVTVQWGVVNTKLDNLEKRLDEMIFESRSLRKEYHVIERRVSYLEGLQEGKQ